eukprot:CAMPEP_0183333278 /NCGR_PEP_ID=MMETSP0164_2-20130417/2217_1 /TAXON_ID=221442 /ORGANISM="Coccolithus pelagicus ssp braarudi, Strain PLY182g" /LENGTH=89 /DNA_ID=CAMNT_0025502173 /DNA_START=21 /DNA_END=286 /DNA_ORIENTATION=+
MTVAGADEKHDLLGAVGAVHAVFVRPSYSPEAAWCGRPQPTPHEDQNTLTLMPLLTHLDPRSLPFLRSAFAYRMPLGTSTSRYGRTHSP